jgi:sugar phosphate isomerase/epimerase
MKKVHLPAALALLCFSVFSCQSHRPPFTEAGDIGTVSHPGSYSFDTESGAYTLTGSGENLWGPKDACYFVWKKVSGDFELSGESVFVGEGVDPHRKVGFMVRESLEADSRYADIAIHGDGLTSLQYRPETGGTTLEVKSEKRSVGSTALAFKREGNRFSIRTGDGTLPEGDDAYIYLDLPQECYLGIFICSHNDSVSETAVVSHVALTQQPDASPKISLFFDHITTAARQEGISFVEAATRIKEMGYTGIDVKVIQRPSEIRTLDSLGFAHACAIVDIDYARGEQRETEDRALAFVEEYGYERLLVVPGLMPDGSTDAERDAVRQRIVAFTDRASARGIDVLVEDYDNARSLCYNAERLDSLFALSDKLGLIYDSGNFLFAGQDPLEQLDHFRARVGHVHLKDRVSATDMRCVPAGTGCVAIEEIVGKLAGSGYRGWYTIEHYGSRQMMSDCETAYRNVAGFLLTKN